jgi:hypothetical protein
MSNGKLPPGMIGLIFTLLGWLCFSALFFYGVYRFFMATHGGRHRLW